jgi:glycosyltransferase involved in cell wall biosynthesis
MLLTDFAAGAERVGIDLSVGYLQQVDSDPAAVRLRARGIEPELVPITGLLKPSDLLRVRRHLAEIRPDVLHTHLGNADFMGGVAARSLGIPMVSTVHVMEWEPGLRNRIKGWLMDQARRRWAETVITVSDPARDALLGAGFGRPEQVITVHNGVDAHSHPGAGKRVRQELGLAPEDLVVSMVSVLREGKGHDTAVAAVAAVQEKFPRVRLLVVGDGPAREQVANVVRPLGAAAVLAGHRDDVMDVLDASDVLLHPSRVDAFPTALLEGLAASLPIVATRVGGIPEIVEDGVSGLLVEPSPRPDSVARALEVILADADLRHRLGAAGRQRFESEFSAERWAHRMREVYQAALHG